MPSATSRKEGSLSFSDKGYVKAWMRVSEAVSEALQSGGSHTVPLPHACDVEGFPEAYAWMREAMRISGLNHPKDTDRITPWWCWIQTDQGRERPGAEYFGESGVILELLIPVEEILISRFTPWHFVLNHWHIAVDEAQDDEFDRRYTEAGLKIGEREIPKAFQDEIRASWEHIFDLNAPDGYWCNRISEEDLQGVFWELRPEMIVRRFPHVETTSWE